jgi:hypothetical protein
VLKISIYSLPLIIVIALIYFYETRIQNGSLNEVNYLKYLKDDWKQIISPLILVFLLLSVYLMNRENNSSVKLILTITLSEIVIFVVFSFLGVYPCDITNKRCVGLFVLTLLSLSLMFWFYFIYLLVKLEILNIFLPVLFGLIIFCWGFVLQKAPIGNSYKIYKVAYGNFLELKNMDVDSYNNIYVLYFHNPTIRYLCEYGALKGKTKNYPSSFTFEKGDQHNISVVQNSVQEENSINDYVPDKNYDLIIGDSIYQGNPAKEIHQRIIEE